MTIDDSTGAPASPLRCRAAAWVGRSVQVLWSRRRALAIIAVVALSLAPAIHIFHHTLVVRRDIAYWDEYDTALAFILKLREGITPEAFLQDLFAVNNEHRMVTSRLLFAGSYWLTGTINFAVIDLVGNATIVALCVLLVASTGTLARRLQLGVLLAFLIFQLEHYENFLWSGSSIDHFQVVLLSAGALFALNRKTRAATLAGGLLAILATFTLAHGLAVWPMGALLLALSGRRRDLAIWGTVGLLAVAGFFTGFSVNAAESFVSFSPTGVRKVVHYWLSILGAVPALGQARAAPWLGGGLLCILVYVGWRGAPRRDRLALMLAGFALAAAGLIAIGRAEHSAGEVYSRYYVLSALAWALALFMLLNRHTHPRRPLPVLAAILPPLLAFNLVANRLFADEFDSWLNCRDIAAVNYKQYGADGHGPFKLHPAPARSTALLRQAEARGVYQLGPICLPVRFPAKAAESSRITYFLEEISTAGEAAAVRGWAAISGQTLSRGSIHLVLRSGTATHVFTTVTIPRTDVAKAMRQAGWTNAGFHFARRLAKMPAGEFQIGLLVYDDATPYYIMTDHRITLPGADYDVATADGN